MIDEQTWARLIDAAVEAASHAYAPYSKFKVGAALLTPDDEIILGCNIEYASFGATVCAERTALGSAVVQGKREFIALAVHTDAERPTAPCGICRQSLAEFCGDMPILMVTASGQRLLMSLDELLPYRFSKDDI